MKCCSNFSSTGLICPSRSLSCRKSPSVFPCMKVSVSDRLPTLLRVGDKPLSFIAFKHLYSESTFFCLSTNL